LALALKCGCFFVETTDASHVPIKLEEVCFSKRSDDFAIDSMFSRLDEIAVNG
jgi:hypothetical protein